MVFLPGWEMRRPLRLGLDVVGGDGMAVAITDGNGGMAKWLMGVCRGRSTGNILDWPGQFH